MDARYFSPAIGRFISQDSYDGASTAPLTQNRYVYSLNNPLTFVDPSGNIPILVPLIGAGVGAAIGATGYLLSINITGAEFDWRDLTVATAGGAVGGLLAPYAATSYIGASILGASLNAAQYMVSKTWKGEDYSLTDVAFAGATGAIGGALAGPNSAVKDYASMVSDLPASRVLANPKLYEDLYVKAAADAGWNAAKRQASFGSVARGLASAVESNAPNPFGSTRTSNLECIGDVCLMPY